MNVDPDVDLYSADTDDKVGLSDFQDIKYCI